MPGWQLVLSCEHAGNRVPAPHSSLFAGKEDVLGTHRGYDIGILPFAVQLAGSFGVNLHSCMITRLLVDANRSLHSPTLFSEFSRGLTPAQRSDLVDRYYRPFRLAVSAEVDRALGRGKKVVHLSLHSFTPEFCGLTRNADVGLLYDPAKAGERNFCRLWRAELVNLNPYWRVRSNYPYRGISDSLVTALRRRLPAPARYLGLELEVNQGRPLGASADWERLQHDLIHSLRLTLAAWTSAKDPGPD